MKFDLIQKKLHESGIDFEYFATGHYARIKNTGKGFSLLRAIDKHKDQSYFLYRLDRNQLAKTLFPLGEMTKHDVRKVAVSAVLSVSEKAESQDFYSGDYRELLKNLAVSTGNGNIIDQAGTILGTHTGIHNFTIGQRKGLGICSSEPLYVTGIDVNSKNIIVGPGSSRLKKSLVARDLNLLTDNTPQMLQARIRSTHKPADCSVKLTGDNMEVLFDDLQENITPGQSVVVYDGDIVIGGGILQMHIEESPSSLSPPPSMQQIEPSFSDSDQCILFQKKLYFYLNQRYAGENH
jgi:tRNA-specific 2-thiouridylase